MTSKAIPLSLFDRPDKIVWHYIRDGEYSVSSRYTTMHMLSRNGVGLSVGEGEQSSSEGRFNWSGIWNLNVPHKLKRFIWQCVHEFLPVGANLVKRGLRVDNNYCFCAEEIETTVHLFSSCQFAKLVWFSCSLQLDSMQLGEESFTIWWSALNQKLRVRGSGCDLNRKAVFVLCCIWKARNDQIFNGKYSNPFVAARKADDDDWELARIESDDGYLARAEKEGGAASIPRYGEQQNYIPTEVRRWDFKWEPPDRGLVKCNLDGAWNELTYEGGVGLIVRDSRGHFIAAKAINIGLASSALAVEAFGMREGLTFAAEISASVVAFESDSQSLINHLKAGGYV